MDLKIARKRMLVPAEEDAIGHRLDIHVRASGRGSVGRRILNDFLVKPPVLAPAGDGVSLSETKGKFRHVEVAMDEFSREAILFFLAEFFADKKLKKLNFPVHYR